MIANTWKGLKPGSFESEVTAALGPPEREVSAVTYGSTGGLRMLDYYELGVSVFLRDERVLLMTVAPQPNDVFPRDADEWVAQLGQPEQKLPSTSGKNHRTWLYCDRGLTVTVELNQVELVEIFQPMSCDSYQANFYTRPPVFIK